MFFKLNTTARILTSLLLALASPQMLSAAGPAPVNLLSTANFTILAGAAITTTGGGTIVGDVGASPISGSAIHLTCPQVSGTIYAVDAAGPACAVVDPSLLTIAKNDLMTAMTDAAGRTTPTSVNIGGPAGIGGLNLAPGLYKFSTTVLIAGSDLTLTGGPDDVWIFQCAQDLELMSGIKVILAGGAQAKNIFWQVGTSATIGTSAVFNGTILASQAITMNTSSTMNGRALAFTAGVTYNGAGASVPSSTNLLGPVIAVQQPLGTNLVNGVGTNDFGFVAVGTSNSLTFTITNIGAANLTVSNITIDGVNSAMFTVTTNPTPVLLVPGGRTNFTVRFTPGSTGLKTAELHIANTDPNGNPFNIALTGMGTGTGGIPRIAVEQPLGTNLVSGSTKDFGPVALSTSNSLTFTIKNTGNSNLIVSSIAIVGSTNFTVTTNPTPATVIPGDSTNFTVQFAPGSLLGVQTATLHIVNNDTNSNPFNIVLTGTGGTPQIVVQQPLGTNLVSGVSSNYFGSVAVGTNTSLTFTITNSGNANLTGLGITIDGTNSAMFIVTTNPTAPVIPGGSTTFTVRFAPVSAGLQTAALHIANNTTNNPFNIIITGTGTGGVTSSTNVFVTGISSITLNPQTGLFEQTVQFYNNSTNTIAAVRLLILSLPNDVQVYNASGFTNGIPYLQYNLPLAPAATVSFVVEYYSADRPTNWFSQPVFFVQETALASVPNPTGTVLAIHSDLQLGTNRFLIEFTATPGQRYVVQYSSDLTNWQTAVPTIIAPANRVQWYDDGPPKTESKPTTVGSRFYRVIELH